MFSDPKFVTRRLSFAVNVRGFDVDPEGTDDSSVGFQDAIDVCRERDYSTLRVPSGIYTISMFSAGASCSDTGICLDDLVGLCIHGDGPDRGGAGDNTGTVIRFDFSKFSPGGIGIGVRGSEALRFENLTIERVGGEDAIGVQIESATGESRAIQFQNVTFRGWDIAVQTGDGAACDELSFYDCDFTGNRIGFKSNTSSALSQKFVGCTGGGDGSGGPLDGMETMFDLEGGGGNLTVLGFGGQNIKTLVLVGGGDGSIGWNLLHNVRLEQLGDGVSEWGEEFRTKLYEAAQTTTGTNQRTEFSGVVITPPTMGDPKDTGVRISLLKGHTVVLRNASAAAGDYELATASAKLLEFAGTEGDRGGTLLCFNVTVPLDARVDRDTVPEENAFYSFRECNDLNVPYPDRLHEPLYGPNYLMRVESHCWTTGDGLNGVTAQGTGTVANAAPSDQFRAGVIECEATNPGFAAIASAPNALKQLIGGVWHCQLSVRVPTNSQDLYVRAGFADNASSAPTSGVYFEYDSLSSANWQAVSATGPSDTGVEVGTAWHTLEIVVDAAGNCKFYVNGFERDASTSPAGELGLLPLQVQYNGEGGGTVKAQIDYYKYTFRPDTDEVGRMYPE